MPTKAEQAKHGGVARVRTVRRGNVLYTVYFYNDGRSTADKRRRRKPHGAKRKTTPAA